MVGQRRVPRKIGPQRTRRQPPSAFFGREALDSVLADIETLGGKGGLIAVGSDGEAAWGFTTPAMYRGMADATGRTVAIYSDEDDR